MASRWRATGLLHRPCDPCPAAILPSEGGKGTSVANFSRGNDLVTEIPPGFHLTDGIDAVMGAFAPVYIRRESSGLITLGFRVGPQHCNPRGNCHGGTWATLADVLMGLNVGFVTGLSGPTVSMSIDFLASATTSQWVEGSARVLRSTPNLGFAECTFTAEGELALRANAVFRRKLPPHLSFEQLLAPT